MTNFEKVGLFMKTFGQEVKTNASFSSDKINKLRIDLIEEELEELKDAMKKKDLKETIDALTDILYVTYGAGHAFGINLDDAFELAQEIENICHQYTIALKLGQPKILSFEEMKKVLDKAKNYKKG